MPFFGLFRPCQYLCGPVIDRRTGEQATDSYPRMDDLRTRNRAIPGVKTSLQIALLLPLTRPIGDNSGENHPTKNDVPVSRAQTGFPDAFEPHERGSPGLLSGRLT